MKSGCGSFTVFYFYFSDGRLGRCGHELGPEHGNTVRAIELSAALVCPPVPRRRAGTMFRRNNQKNILLD